MPLPRLHPTIPWVTHSMAYLSVPWTVASWNPAHTDRLGNQTAYTVCCQPAFVYSLGLLDRGNPNPRRGSRVFDKVLTTWVPYPTPQEIGVGLTHMHARIRYKEIQLSTSSLLSCEHGIDSKPYIRELTVNITNGSIRLAYFSTMSRE